LHILDFDLQGGAVGIRVGLRTNELGGIDKLNVFPLRVAFETGSCHLNTNLTTVGCDGGNSGEFEEGMGRAFQYMSVIPLGLGMFEKRKQDTLLHLTVHGLVKDNGEVVADPL
jgi:hypothetical protein